MSIHTALTAEGPPIALDSGNTAWLLVSASLVLFMTIPGLALFYGGLGRAKSALNMMMMSFGAMGVVGILYVLFGYSMSFGSHDIGGVIAGPFEFFGLKGMLPGEPGASSTIMGDGIPTLVFAGFQLTFAVITVALISGAIADRAKFSTWLVFCGLFVTLVYFPLAHMVWGGGLLSASSDGLAARMFGTTDDAATVAPIDFAGGTVVHINAGIAGLVLALLLGKRIGFGRTPMRPHNVPLVMLGSGILWFGWFGFNAGSALGANESAALAWVNTTAATCAAMMGWLVVEKRREGHMTSVGAASGVVAGLVAITPACGNVTPVGAIGVGLVAGGLAAVAVGLKYRFGLDDSLDVVGVHLVAGLWGTISLGIFARGTGLAYGEWRQLVVQVVIALVALTYTAILTAGIGYALKATMGWRIDADDEIAGIDTAEHAESAYDLVGFGGSKHIGQSKPEHDARHHHEISRKGAKA
ncbi:ammonium transporter [Yimella sp. cx-51]|uniref:ammonium transporter n=1 Tax=Yimella sp. cx-51 TaxID=2770551 RepID=UPI00165E55A7|nr:ammonium transporter [Yimella sp. cx-51]MBC9956744.1 ammonium transporter [Yimella sp. cx-51]MBD2759172.1 ammonium transporter [Yimella sp. cx-573]QTH38980.1 ammonium transporter [Yimella sp. cx-51]